MEKWDDFVSKCGRGHFMQSHAWGKFKESSGWKVRYLLAIKKNKMKGASLLLSKPLPVLGKHIYYLPRGPVVEHDDSEALSFLLKNIRKYVEENNGVFLRVDPYFEESETYDSIFKGIGFKKIERTWSFWNSPKYIFWLNLDIGIENILKKMPKKKRYEIRVPHKKGVKYMKGGLSDIRDFYTLMVETAERKDIGTHDLGYYEKLYKILGDSGIAQLFLAKYDGEVVAAGISLAYGKRAWLLYMASSKKHFHLMPNRALQWEMIKWAVERGCEVYDFRGTATDDPPNPNDPGYGVYKFKKSFGPEFVRTVGYYDYVVNKLLYRVLIFAEDHFLTHLVGGAEKISKIRDQFRKLSPSRH